MHAITALPCAARDRCLHDWRHYCIGYTHTHHHHLRLALSCWYLACAVCARSTCPLACSEISAFRSLGSVIGVDFLIATTKLITGDSLMATLIEDAGTRRQWRCRLLVMQMARRCQLLVRAIH